MRKHASTVLLVAVFLVGLSVLLYPSVSNYLNQINASHAVSNYDEALGFLQDSERGSMLEAARQYNASLASGEQVFRNGAADDVTYRSLLDPSGDGMIGYITIRKLGVELPISHGTSDDVLASGAGHLEGSSLPIGGESTHAVITGHRGLPAARLFTDLDRLETGDTFTITVLGETLYYEVDQIKIVLPGETSDLQIVPGMDYCTLVTCTPYAVNTHRLLVRGRRIDGPQELRISADATQIDPAIAAPIAAAPMLAVLLVILLVSSARREHAAKPGGPAGKKIYKKGMEQNDGQDP